MCYKQNADIQVKIFIFLCIKGICFVISDICCDDHIPVHLHLGRKIVIILGLVMKTLTHLHIVTTCRLPLIKW
jgi:hypothetical protein